MEFNDESKKVRKNNFSGNYIKIKSINLENLGAEVEIKGFIAKDLNDIIIYEVCQNCFKSVGVCKCNRGKNTIFQMVLNLIIDDGTGAIRIVFIGDLAEKLINVKTKNALLIKDLPEYGNFLEKLSSLLLGKNIMLIGKVKLIRQKFEIIVHYFKPLNIDEELERMMKEIVKN